MNLETISKAGKTTFRFLRKNIPNILMGFSTIGSIAIPFLAEKEIPKAKKIFAENKEKDGGKVSGRNIYETGKALAPLIFTEVATLGCMWTADCIHYHRYSRLMHNYNGLVLRFDEYKTETEKVLGDAGKIAVGTAIANNHAPEEMEVIDQEKYQEHQYWFYDSFSQTWFRADWYTVLWAKIKLDEQFARDGVIELQQYYEYLGLDVPFNLVDPEIDYCWDMTFLDQYTDQWWINIDYMPITDKNGDDGWSITFGIEPVPYDSTGEYPTNYYFGDNDLSEYLQKEKP